MTVLLIRVTEPPVVCGAEALDFVKFVNARQKLFHHVEWASPEPDRSTRAGCQSCFVPKCGLRARFRGILYPFVVGRCFETGTDTTADRRLQSPYSTTCLEPPYPDPVAPKRCRETPE